MIKSLWMFVGSVPEEGDICLVWAADAAEAMAEGRRVMGYADAEHDDSDFEVRPATAREMLALASSLVNYKVHEAVGLRPLPDSMFVPDGFLDTEEVRLFLSLKIKAAEVRAVTHALGAAE